MEKRKVYSVTYQNRQYDFSFRYVSTTADGYRAYIENMPSYGSRVTSLTATHRLPGGSEYYICWSGRINSEAEMDAVVELWSQATAMYIANGGSSINKYVEAIQNGDSNSNGIKSYNVNYASRTFDFTFKYEYDQSNGYRAFILSAPSYRNRSDLLTDTHRMKEGNRHYVCWSEKIWSEESLDAVVALWCRATVMYIVLGGDSIDEHAAKLMKA